LIFYQQGLPEEEVAKRAEITIKMANAAGQSAELVSDQLTAVWNNFYDGSKSLEYYADVMTALGAATASSTDEIAGGLEKFAAIADTIGLSYEYAAAALATITSNTRQSEEVVGTALKTIFARLQSLKMGETLEDGLDLTKYSEALEKVGVQVLDANNELIKADELLWNLHESWDSLGKA
jgi:TP901 family phage tail tape measure protein